MKVSEGTYSTADCVNDIGSERFRILCSASNSAHFVLINRTPVENAVLQINSLDGKTVAVKSVHLRNTGTHTIRWNSTDKSGTQVTSGKYICRLQYDGMTVAVRSVTLF